MRVGALLLIVAGFTAYAIYVAWGETLDDAAISFAYSKNLVHGHGLVLNPNAEPVEAYSNFLWVIAMAPVVAVRLDAIVVSKIAGLLLSIGALLLVANAPSRARGDRMGWLDLLAPALTAITLPFALWSVSGMENGLLSCLLMLAVVLTFRELRDERALPWSAIVLFGAAITRPEGIVFFVAAVGHRTLLYALGRRAWRRDVSWLAAFVAPFLAYHIWHYAYFGELVPNTYFAKADHRSIGDLFRYLTDRHDPGFVYVRSFVGDYWLLPALPLAAVSIAGLAQLRAYSLPLLMVLAGGTSALFVGGDWMEYHRFLSPLIPLLFLCAQEGLRNMLEAAQRPGSHEMMRRLVPATGVALAAALVAVVAVGSAKEARAAHDEPFGAPYSLIKARADELEELGARLELDQASVLTPDIGAVGYTTDLNIVDIAGLGDAYIAKHDSREEVATYVFDVRRPDIISLNGIWAQNSGLGDDPRLARDYVAVRGGYDAEGTFLGGTFVRRDRVVFEGSCPDALPWDGVPSVATSVTVAGPVVAEQRSQVADDATVLFLGLADGLPVVIRPEDAAYFPIPPHRVYLGRQVCVTGTTGTYEGAPAVFVTRPRDLLVSGTVEASEPLLSLDGGWALEEDGVTRTPLAEAAGGVTTKAEMLDRLRDGGYRRVLLTPGSDAEAVIRTAASYDARTFEPQFGAPDLGLRETRDGSYRWSWSFSPDAVERISVPRFVVPEDIDPNRPSLEFDVRYAPSGDASDSAVTLDVAYYQAFEAGGIGEVHDLVRNVPLAGATALTPLDLLIAPDGKFLRADAYQVIVIRLGDHNLDTFAGTVLVEGLRILYWPQRVRPFDDSGLLVYDLPE